MYAGPLTGVSIEADEPTASEAGSDIAVDGTFDGACDFRRDGTCDDSCVSSLTRREIKIV